VILHQQGQWTVWRERQKISPDHRQERNASHTHHDCRCLVSRKLVLREILRPLSHCGVLFFERSARVEGVGVRELSPDESCISASPRIVGGTHWCLGRRHTGEDEDRKVSPQRASQVEQFILASLRPWARGHDQPRKAQILQKGNLNRCHM
jgi:hypothetical protein